MYCKSQDSLAKHFSCDGLLHYKFIIHFASERIFKIGEHLVKLQAKWLIMSYASFALRLLSSKMQNSLDIKITCLLQTETVTDCCYINRQITVSLLLTNIRLLQASFDLLTDRLMPSVTDRLLIMYGILLQHLFLCYSSCIQLIMAFFKLLVWTSFLLN